MPTSPQVILHLTDLHFGSDRDINDRNLRAASQRTLLATLAEMPAGWKPTIICLSGDIGWHGTEADYGLAKSWLDELLACCELDYSRVLIAAGNHDIIRDVASYSPRPTNWSDADQALRLPIGRTYKEAFENYTQFCVQAGIPPMRFHGEDSWLVGERLVDDIRFVTINSSWFCRDGDDRGKLWMGLPQLRDLETQGQLGFIENPATPLTIALVHHPADWLHESERLTYDGGRPNTRDFLAKRSHLILTGHTHARLAHPDRLARAAYHFPGAAAYAGGAHPNGFRLIRLAPEQFEYRSYEYDAGADRPTWRQFDEEAVDRQALPRLTVEADEEQKKKLAH